jgi:hypothetical protein
MRLTTVRHGWLRGITRRVAFSSAKENTAAGAFGEPTRPRGGNRLLAEAADKTPDASTQGSTVDCTLLASVVREPQNSGSGPDKSGPVKCSGKPTNEPLENRYCCYDCRVDSCCDWLNVRSWNCCSTNRHATHDSRTSLTMPTRQLALARRLSYSANHCTSHLHQHA